MNLKFFILMSFITFTVGNYTCSDTDCHECIGEICHLSCQGDGCRDCPSGDCCKGNNCNICIDSICCSTAKCNGCVNKQRKSCSSSSDCNAMIFQKCEFNSEEQILGNINVNSGHPNVTTIIKIRNLINNTNIIDTPIQLNLTYENDIMLNKTNNSPFMFHNPSIISPKSLERRKQRCCSIVHPQECYKASALKYQICFTRRHTECSDLCNNATNMVIKTDRTKQCIVIAVHPYYYCGYYAIEDCSACFNCTEVSRIKCLEEPTCSKTCRSSILPTRFYNVPYHIKSTNTSSMSDNENTKWNGEPAIE